LLLLFTSYLKARRIVDQRCTGKLIKFSSPYGFLAHVTGLIDRVGYLELIGHFTCTSESILVEYRLRSFSPWLASILLDAAVGGDVVQDPAQVIFIISKNPYSTKPTVGIGDCMISFFVKPTVLLQSPPWCALASSFPFEITSTVTGASLPLLSSLLEEIQNGCLLPSPHLLYFVGTLKNGYVRNVPLPPVINGV
jgi:hypothetical protein